MKRMGYSPFISIVVVAALLACAAAYVIIEPPEKLTSLKFCSQEKFGVTLEFEDLSFTGTSPASLLVGNDGLTAVDDRGLIPSRVECNPGYEGHGLHFDGHHFLVHEPELVSTDDKMNRVVYRNKNAVDLQSGEGINTNVPQSYESSVSDEFFISMNLRRETGTGYTALVAKAEATGRRRGWVLSLTPNGNVRFTIREDATQSLTYNVESQDSVGENTWTYLQVLSQVSADTGARETKILINGTESIPTVTHDQLSGASDQGIGTNMPLTIGGLAVHSGGCSYSPFRGSLDNVMITISGPNAPVGATHLLERGTQAHPWISPSSTSVYAREWTGAMDEDPSVGAHAECEQVTRLSQNVPFLNELLDTTISLNAGISPVVAVDMVLTARDAKPSSMLEDAVSLTVATETTETFGLAPLISSVSQKLVESPTLTLRQALNESLLSPVGPNGRRLAQMNMGDGLLNPTWSPEEQQSAQHLAEMVDAILNSVCGAHGSTTVSSGDGIIARLFGPRGRNTLKRQLLGSKSFFDVFTAGIHSSVASSTCVAPYKECSMNGYGGCSDTLSKCESSSSAWDCISAWKRCNAQSSDAASCYSDYATCIEGIPAATVTLLSSRCSVPALLPQITLRPPRPTNPFDFDDIFIPSVPDVVDETICMGICDELIDGECVPVHGECMNSTGCPEGFYCDRSIPCRHECRENAAAPPNTLYMVTEDANSGVTRTCSSRGLRVSFAVDDAGAVNMGMQGFDANPTGERSQCIATLSKDAATLGNAASAVGESNLKTHLESVASALTSGQYDAAEASNILNEISQLRSAIGEGYSLALFNVLHEFSAKKVATSRPIRNSPTTKAMKPSEYLRHAISGLRGENADPALTRFLSVLVEKGLADSPLGVGSTYHESLVEALDSIKAGSAEGGLLATLSKAQQSSLSLDDVRKAWAEAKSAASAKKSASSAEDFLDVLVNKGLADSPLGVAESNALDVLVEKGLADSPLGTTSVSGARNLLRKLKDALAKQASSNGENTPQELKNYMDILVNKGLADSPLGLQEGGYAPRGLATSPMGLLEKYLDVLVNKGLADSPLGLLEKYMDVLVNRGLATSPMGLLENYLDVLVNRGLATSPMGIHDQSFSGYIDRQMLSTPASILDKYGDILVNRGLATSPMGLIERYLDVLVNRGLADSPLGVLTRYADVLVNGGLATSPHGGGGIVALENYLDVLVNKGLADSPLGTSLMEKYLDVLINKGLASSPLGTMNIWERYLDVLINKGLATSPMGFTNYLEKYLDVLVNRGLATSPMGFINYLEKYLDVIINRGLATSPMGFSNLMWKYLDVLINRGLASSPLGTSNVVFRAAGVLFRNGLATLSPSTINLLADMYNKGLYGQGHPHEVAYLDSVLQTEITNPAPMAGQEPRLLNMFQRIRASPGTPGAGSFTTVSSLITSFRGRFSMEETGKVFNELAALGLGFDDLASGLVSSDVEAFDRLSESIAAAEKTTIFSSGACSDSSTFSLQQVAMTFAELDHAMSAIENQVTANAPVDTAMLTAFNNAAESIQQTIGGPDGAQAKLAHSANVLTMINTENSALDSGTCALGGRGATGTAAFNALSLASNPVTSTVPQQLQFGDDQAQVLDSTGLCLAHEGQDSCVTKLSSQLCIATTSANCVEPIPSGTRLYHHYVGQDMGVQYHLVILASNNLQFTKAQYYYNSLTTLNVPGFVLDVAHRFDLEKEAPVDPINSFGGEWSGAKWEKAFVSLGSQLTYGYSVLVKEGTDPQGGAVDDAAMGEQPISMFIPATVDSTGGAFNREHVTVSAEAAATIRPLQRVIRGSIVIPAATHPINLVGAKVVSSESCMDMATGEMNENCTSADGKLDPFEGWEAYDSYEQYKSHFPSMFEVRAKPVRMMKEGSRHASRTITVEGAPVLSFTGTTYYGDVDENGNFRIAVLHPRTLDDDAVIGFYVTATAGRFSFVRWIPNLSCDLEIDANENVVICADSEETYNLDVESTVRAYGHQIIDDKLGQVACATTSADGSVHFRDCYAMKDEFAEERVQDAVQRLETRLAAPRFSQERAKMDIVLALTGVPDATSAGRRRLHSCNPYDPTWADECYDATDSPPLNLRSVKDFIVFGSYYNHIAFLANPGAYLEETTYSNYADGVRFYGSGGRAATVYNRLVGYSHYPFIASILSRIEAYLQSFTTLIEDSNGYVVVQPPSSGSGGEVVIGFDPQVQVRSVGLRIQNGNTMWPPSTTERRAFRFTLLDAAGVEIHQFRWYTYQQGDGQFYGITSGSIIDRVVISVKTSDPFVFTDLFYSGQYLAKRIVADRAGNKLLANLGWRANGLWTKASSAPTTFGHPYYNTSLGRFATSSGGSYWSAGYGVASTPSGSSTLESPAFTLSNLVLFQNKDEDPSLWLHGARIDTTATWPTLGSIDDSAASQIRIPGGSPALWENLADRHFHHHESMSTMKAHWSHVHWQAYIDVEDKAQFENVVGYTERYVEYSTDNGATWREAWWYRDLSHHGANGVWHGNHMHPFTDSDLVNDLMGTDFNGDPSTTGTDFDKDGVDDYVSTCDNNYDGVIDANDTREWDTEFYMEYIPLSSTTTYPTPTGYGSTFTTSSSPPITHTFVASDIEGTSIVYRFRWYSPAPFDSTSCYSTCQGWKIDDVAFNNDDMHVGYYTNFDGSYDYSLG